MPEDKMVQQVLSGKRSLPNVTAAAQWTQQTQQHKEFICGWGAAFVNIAVTFPINKIIFRQMLFGVAFPVAFEQLRREGLRHLYRGLLPPLLQKTTSLSLMFGLYYESHRVLVEQFPSVWLPANKAMAAMIAGTVEGVLTPFERIQTLIQDPKHHGRFGNTFIAFKELRGYGFAEYYRGMSAVLLRNGPSSVMFFLGRDFLRTTFPTATSARERVIYDFLSGAVLGAMISTVFYPLNVVKVRMQCKVGGDFHHFIPTFRALLRDRDYSIWKLFHGVHLNYTRACISWGIINATYELLMSVLFSESAKFRER